MIPALKKKIQLRFNVDLLISKLRNGNLDSDKQTELWNEIKVLDSLFFFPVKLERFCFLMDVLNSRGLRGFVWS